MVKILAPTQAFYNLPQAMYGKKIWFSFFFFILKLFAQRRDSIDPFIIQTIVKTFY